LTDSVDIANAPHPTNDSERLLFRQLFETLVRLDCEGKARPNLALSWSADSGRRVWNFTLHDSSSSARTTEAATTIVSSWRRRLADVRLLGVESASAQGNRLSVSMREPLDSAPLLFADPAMAVSDATDSASLQISETGILSLGPGRLINYRIEPRADPRDVLDRGADLVVTRDPALVEYAGSKAGVATFPLPWSRTYVLLQPAGAEAVPPSVARDAVKGDARSAEPPFWWEDRRQTCAEPAASSQTPTSSRVVYPRGDEAARGLAERIVALAGSEAGLRTTALNASEFSAALAGGIERAYILAVPRQSLAPCRDSAGWPAGATLQPLIDTRAHAIVRRGTPPLGVDWDGTVRLDEEWTGRDQP
jgi:hypothetical protein